MRHSLRLALPGVRQENCDAFRREIAYAGPIRLHTDRRMTLIPCIVPRGGNTCDFCQTSPVFTAYACSNFLVNGNPVFPSGLAVGSWAACRKCAELVDREKWNDLTERAYRKFAKRHGDARQMLAVRIQFAKVSRSFSEHRVRKS